VIAFRFAVISLLTVSMGISQVAASGSFQQGIAATSNRPDQPAPGAEPAKEQPPASLEGQIVNAITGEPIKRANVLLFPTNQPRPDASSSMTTSDANGHFAMTNVAPGTYMLRAERTGYVSASYGARDATRPGTAITLAPSQALKEIAFRLQPHAVVSGRILDEDGEPMANVQVQVLTPRYMQGKKQLMPAGGGSTNDLGEYRVFGLAPGKYYVSATYQSNGMGYMAVDRSANANKMDEGYAPTYYPGSNDFSAAVAVPVAAGRPVTNIDMKLIRVRTVRVRGKVTNPLGSGPGRTMVMLAPRDTAGFNMFGRNLGAPQGRDGKFEIRGVTPGAYNLMAQYFDGTTRYSSRIPVNVGNGNLEDVDVTLQPGLDVSGTVRIEGDTESKLGSLNIILQPKEFGPMVGGGSSRIKDDGSFMLKNVSPDTYRAMVFGGQGVYTKSVYVGQQEAKNGEIMIPEGTPPPITVVLSANGGQVSGQVKAEKEGAARGAMVVLVPSAEHREDQQYFKVTSLDQYGKFSLTAIPPGDYTLYAWDGADTGAWQDPEFLARYQNKGKSLSIKEKDSVTAEVELLKVDEGQ
jgi:carboxypeptidase family protein